MADEKKINATGLKKKFVARATPTQTDFTDLIELADLGRKGAGYDSKDILARPTPGAGLTADAGGKLALNVDGASRRLEQNVLTLANPETLKQSYETYPHEQLKTALNQSQGDHPSKPRLILPAISLPMKANNALQRELPFRISIRNQRAES